MTGLDRAHERKAEFKRRLEAFSDIVFGLSLSELALLLGLPNKPSDLVAHPARYVVFFGSFAIVCAFWYSHHRMFRYFYPGRLDVFLNFAYLAFAVLVPFGMQAMIKFGGNPTAFGVYVASFIGTSVTMLGLIVRGLRHHPERRAEVESAQLFRRAVVMALASVILGGALILLRVSYEAAATEPLLMVPLFILARMTVRSVPDFVFAGIPRADRDSEAAAP